MKCLNEVEHEMKSNQPNTVYEYFFRLFSAGGVNLSSQRSVLSTRVANRQQKRRRSFNGDVPSTGRIENDASKGLSEHDKLLVIEREFEEVVLKNESKKNVGKKICIGKKIIKQNDRQNKWRSEEDEIVTEL